MIAGGRALGLIPARGGSKGVPGKNIRSVGGKPLIAWTIEAAKASRYLDRVILSSDDEKIMTVARGYGCDVPFKREAKLAADDTPGIDVVLDTLERCPGYEWVVLLQPTSPLRTSLDIDATIQQCVALNAPACVSVCMTEQSPYWMYVIQDEAHLHPILPPTGISRRQDLPPVYVLNGAVYVARTEWLIKERGFITAETVAYKMPNERSIDIDTELDFLQLQAIVEKLLVCSRSPIT